MNPRHSKFRHYTGNLRMCKGLWFYGRHGLYVLQFLSFSSNINSKLPVILQVFYAVCLFQYSERHNCSEDMLQEYLVCFCYLQIMFCSASMFVGYCSEFQLHGGFSFCLRLPLAITGTMLRSWQANLQIWSSLLFHSAEMSSLPTDELTGINLICISGPFIALLHFIWGVNWSMMSKPNDSIQIHMYFSAIFVFFVNIARLLVWSWDVAYYVCLIDEISIVILLPFFFNMKIKWLLGMWGHSSWKVVCLDLFVGSSSAIVHWSFKDHVPLLILFLFWMLLHGVWNLNPVRAL